MVNEYIKQLEDQNEDLRNKLANLEQHHDQYSKDVNTMMMLHREFALRAVNKNNQAEYIAVIDFGDYIEGIIKNIESLDKKGAN